jgi:predicted ferric reductase
MTTSTKIRWRVYGTGLASTVALYLYILYYQAHDASKAALGMPSMHMNHLAKFWSFPILQATGLVGLLTAYLALFFGLQQSGRKATWLKMSAPDIDLTHRSLSLLTLWLVIAHVVATAFDAMGDSWRTVLWFNGWATNWPQASWAYNIGIVSMYLIVVLGPSYYIRKSVGIARWKFLHRFVVIFYILAFWHALILGLDFGGYPWIRPVAWFLQVPLLWLFAERMRQIAQRQKQAVAGQVVAWTVAAAAYAGLVAVAFLLVTGNWGFVSVQ